MELVRDTDVFPCDPTENLPPAVLLGASRLLLNGRAVINGQPVRPLALPRLLPPPAGLSTSATAAATTAAAASTPLPTPTAAGGLPPGSTPEPSAVAAAAPADSAAPAADGQQQQARPADAKALAEVRTFSAAAGAGSAWDPALVVTACRASCPGAGSHYKPLMQVLHPSLSLAHGCRRHCRPTPPTYPRPLSPCP